MTDMHLFARIFSVSNRTSKYNSSNQVIILKAMLFKAQGPLANRINGNIEKINKMLIFWCEIWMQWHITSTVQGLGSSGLLYNKHFIY